MPEPCAANQPTLDAIRNATRRRLSIFNDLNGSTLNESRENSAVFFIRRFVALTVCGHSIREILSPACKNSASAHPLFAFQKTRIRLAHAPVSRRRMCISSHRYPQAFVIFGYHMHLVPLHGNWTARAPAWYPLGSGPQAPSPAHVDPMWHRHSCQALLPVRVGTFLEPGAVELALSEVEGTRHEPDLHQSIPWAPPSRTAEASVSEPETVRDRLRCCFAEAPNGSYQARASAGW